MRRAQCCHAAAIRRHAALPPPPSAQDYVAERVRQFAKAFAAEVVPELPEDQLEAITSRIMSQHAPAEPPPELVAPMLAAQPIVAPMMNVAAMAGMATLEFRHDCL